jgi:hypothetical protein
MVTATPASMLARATAKPIPGGPPMIATRWSL